MTSYQRAPRPDPYEIMPFARSHVFARILPGVYLIIAALPNSVSLSRWQKGDHEPSSVYYLWQSAGQLGLYDGEAWDIPALATWLESHCAVCWQPLVGKQRRYCSNLCKQRAYRSRKL